jgi:uncharacterized protein YndB with AHSA1/START domain
MEKIAVERRAWIHASSQQVWCAITEPRQLEQWYAPGCPWEMIPALQAGATVKFHNTETDIQLARIEVVEPLKELTLRWQIEEADPSMSLVNSFRLEEENGGTRVTVTQAGYESLPEDVRQQMVEQDEAAYMAIVENLKTYLERKT